MNQEDHILHSWHRNAGAWTEAVQQAQIESRTLVTNRAVVDVVMAQAPRTVADLGCGEGWLARTLADRGVRVTGVDAVPTLIEHAPETGGVTYRALTYDDIVRGGLSADAPFDALVCNFSLFGQVSVEELLAYLPTLLAPAGHLIIQTLHPMVANLEQPYRDGWRSGSWQGFSERFVDPAPWYFRTTASWIHLLRCSGLVLTELHEPLHPRTQQPASVIFVSTPQAAS
jgi:2-polyprenyl-3-methyl-5-hydroxy-6-metoxy-1,4-benzoquinol methylase